jgi:hypothetical protein
MRSQSDTALKLHNKNGTLTVRALMLGYREYRDAPGGSYSVIDCICGGDPALFRVVFHCEDDVRQNRRETFTSVGAARRFARNILREYGRADMMTTATE